MTATSGEAEAEGWVDAETGVRGRGRGRGDGGRGRRGDGGTGGMGGGGTGGRRESETGGRGDAETFFNELVAALRFDFDFLFGINYFRFVFFSAKKRVRVTLSFRFTRLSASPRFSLSTPPRVSAAPRPLSLALVQRIPSFAIEVVEVLSLNEIKAAFRRTVQ